MELAAARRRLQTVLSKVGSQVAEVLGKPRSSTPARAEVGGPLDTINDNFHDHYAEARTEARREVPVFLVLADELIVFYRDERTAFSFAPRSFHVIKSVTHAPLAIFAALERLEHGRLDEAAQEALRAHQQRLHEALARLDSDAGDLLRETRQDLRAVLEASSRFVDALEVEVTRAQLAAFAKPLGPILLRLADAATQLQLDALHGHTERALQHLDRDARTRLQVVVAGDHQARARSLAMQYFQQRLREPQDHERRVTYAEGVSDEEGALALVGTRRLDHVLGRAFFGEEARLQRDILGDAAHARLAASHFAPIE